MLHQELMHDNACLNQRPPVFSLIPPTRSADDLLQMECSYTVMIKNLEQVVTMVLNLFQDPHPRVCWAAINANGQLSTDLGPDLQVQYHQRVLRALASAMDDFQNPRVQMVIGGWRRELSAGQWDECWRWYLLGLGKAFNKVQEVYRCAFCGMHYIDVHLVGPCSIQFSFWGTSKHELLELSQQGDNRTIDMLVGDIYGRMDYSEDKSLKKHTISWGAAIRACGALGLIQTVNLMDLAVDGGCPKNLRGWRIFIHSFNS